MADIFISYARDDLYKIRPIVKLIEENGWSVFWDRTIPAGLTWREYIGKALDDAKCVIVFWSRNSVKSEFVQEEADDGRGRKILIPIRIDNARIPLGFRAIQHEDFTNWKGEPYDRRVKILIKDIEGIVGKPQKGVTKPFVKPKSKAEQTAKPPKPAHSEPKKAATNREAVMLTESKPSDLKPGIKKPKKSSASKIVISIAMSLSIVVGLILLFRYWSTITGNASKLMQDKIPAAEFKVPSSIKDFENNSEVEQKIEIQNPDSEFTKAVANHNDIIGFQILSALPSYLEIKIDYYYNGKYGPAWLSVVPKLHGRDTDNFYYLNGQCATNNAIKVGHNSTCIRIAIVKGKHLVQFSTDAIEICMFSGTGTEKYCESFYINKQWSSSQ